MVYAQSGIRLGAWEGQILRLWEYGSPKLGQTTTPCDSQQKKTTCQIVVFTVPADDRVKIKNGEKRGKYLDLVRELKKL